MSPAFVADRGDLEAALREGLALGTNVRVWTTSALQRLLAIDPSSGRVTLVATFAERAYWPRAYTPLRNVLAAAADLVAYGLVKHGSDVSSAARGDSLVFDWPARPGGLGLNVPRTAEAMVEARAAEAFEDVYAPDAFASQLLGPGYEGRIPTGGRWRSEPVGSASTLLEQLDLSTWFEYEFVPFNPGMKGARNVASPPVLEAAREDFREVLYSPSLGLG